MVLDDVPHDRKSEPRPAGHTRAALVDAVEALEDARQLPKTQKASDLMTDAPGTVDARQLKELAIKILEG
jgi:aspartyl-tRNA synthetase